MKKRLPLVLVFIATLVALAINNNQSFKSESAPASDSKKLSYSWQVFDSTSWQLDKRTPQQKQVYLQAKAVFYQNETKQSHFTQPYIIQQKPDSLVFVKSLEGDSQEDAIVHLKGHVRIDSYSPKTKENKTLKTEQITYNSQTELLKSDVFTELTGPDMQISGIGFTADLKKDTYDFKSNVKTHYQPR
ncbi:MAG: LPS export ABC transporter periplasmic protein LptC [Hydrogenovibrio sp.]|nr:LPS export ABC transporter periplasmic protein LptC [Hydrogenovibrio sp.]